MKKKRIIAAFCAVLLAIGPVWAVFKEDNLNHTLSVLLMELKETYTGLIRFSGSADKRIKEQHQRLVELIDECNELSVMLYSQASDNTFDLTYALNEVTKIIIDSKRDLIWLTQYPGLGLSVARMNCKTTAIGSIKVSKQSNVYYDLQGRRINQPTKGIYIKNGQKLIK